MGKRTTIVVSSSDDDETARSWHSSCSRSKSKSKRLVAPANSGGSKKARISRYRFRPSEVSRPTDEFELFCENFQEGSAGFKVLESGLERSNREELWVDKYKPHSLEELAVQKKKVDEVKVWVVDKLRASQGECHSHVLLITGQAGVGKSATIHTIASHLGARLCDWSTPTPTIWQEHMHNSNSGLRYTSKLDEFENFVERIRKYRLLPVSKDGELKSPVILLIDDLPMTNGRGAYWRLKNCLHLLVQSTQVPTAILITDYGKVDSTNCTTYHAEELQLSLESAGAYKVAFNPITVNSIKKTLYRICRHEQCNVSAEQIDLIAKACGGDIRHAITSLQYFCLKPDPTLSLSLSYCTPSNMKEKSNQPQPSDDEFSLSFGRDESLSLFHALGKFLHNKRETAEAIVSDQDGFLLRDRFTRLPLKMDAPEKVLSQAHAQARSVTDFLHENVLDFLSEEAIEDTSAVASYLSDADFLLASLHGMTSRNFEAENIIQTTAASVAVRGVLFGNSHPLSSRWHAIRRPKLWQVEQSLSRSKDEMLTHRFVPYNCLNPSDATVIATEFTPVLKWLGDRASGCYEAQGNETEEESSDRMSLDGQGEISADEIEEW